ncbi:heat shock cognate 70 kDa protein-like [Entamoeba marina]
MDDPITVGQSFDKSITGTKRLIGLNFSEEKTQEEIEKLPYVCEQADGDKIAILIEHNGEDQLISPEENCRKIAGFDVIEILNEPIAAALAYGFDKKNIPRILVFDFGKETLDITIATLENNNFNIDYIDRDQHLGGIDVDRYTADIILEQWALYDEDIEKKRNEVKKKRDILKMVAEKTKIQLSYRTAVNIELDEFYVNGFDDQPYIFITIDEFEEANTKIFERISVLLRNVFINSGFHPDDIDKVILAGGNS